MYHLYHFHSFQWMINGFIRLALFIVGGSLMPVAYGEDYVGKTFFPIILDGKIVHPDDGADFTGAILAYRNLFSDDTLTLNDINFSRCKMQGFYVDSFIDFVRCNFCNADLRDATLRCSSGCNFKRRDDRRS